MVPTTDDAEVMRAIVSVAVLADDFFLRIHAAACPACNNNGWHLSLSLHAYVRLGGDTFKQYGSFCVCKTCTAPHWRFSPLVPSAWLASVRLAQPNWGRQ